MNQDPTSRASRLDTLGSTLPTGRLWGATGLAFLLALLFFTFLYAPSPLIYDSDSYYHLALAREYSSEGIVSQLPWLRFGLLAEHFGDKELLLHLFLAPLTHIFGPQLGGRIGLALLGALILTIVAHFSLRAVGAWGVLVPFWLVIGSSELTWRLVRLRAELLSLAILLVALWLAGRRRYRWLGLTAFLYALAYTAIHAFVGLFVMLFLLVAWVRRRWEWPLVLYPVLGAGLGLLVHPHFPENLAVWWLQSVDFFQFKGSLDVGTEIGPNFTDVVLMVNLGWFLGLAILWRSSQSSKKTPDTEDQVALSFGLGAMVFGILYLLMSRFVLYFVPMATLWLLFEMRRRGRTWSGWTRLPWRGRIPQVAAWAICLAVSLPVASGELQRYRERTAPGPDEVRLVDLRHLAAELPAGATVAASWRSTPLYMFYAPQARYLNVLDPVFLAAVAPEQHNAWEEVITGREPDVPLVLAGILDSEFLAFSTASEGKKLLPRLASDPRIQRRHQQIHALFQVVPTTPGDFVLDWRMVPSGSRLPLSNDANLDLWDFYPRLDQEVGGKLEGFVNARRVAPSGDCVAWVHVEQVAVETRITWEFAPYGPSVLWLDGEQVVETSADMRAVLGEGLVLTLALTPGEHRLSVLTCPDRASRTYTGFYLLRRG